MDPFNLARFRTAQEGVFERAREELRAGRKRSHWMWFMFPQMRGLGASETSRFYGIGSRAEAEAYLGDLELGARLIELFGIVAMQEGASARAIFGSSDDQKFRSCATLFASLPGAPPVFARVLDRYFGGASDARTLELLGGNGGILASTERG
jgi:uncharacterized protein (DUF1810 family)